MSTRKSLKADVFEHDGGTLIGEIRAKEEGDTRHVGVELSTMSTVVKCPLATAVQVPGGSQQQVFQKTL